MRAFFALAVLLLSGCTGTYNGGFLDTTTTSGPYDHTSLVNHDDQFVLAGDVQLFDSNTTYRWHTTHTDYTATWGGHLTDGTVTITIKDLLGQPVYSHTFRADSDSSGNEPAKGTLQGDWTLQVSFTKASGSIYFVIQ